MKKIAFALLGIALIGCEKAELPQKKDCNCGFIESDDNYFKDGNHFYTITVKNDCSGNYKTFFLEQGYWMNAHPGNKTCFNNVDNW